MAEKASSFSLFLIGTLIIAVNRLKGSDNYQSWANSVTLWFTGNGVEDHLTSMKSSVVVDKRPQWWKHDALLCNILQQSIEPKTLDNLGDYQTCQPLWTQAKNLYTNDVQRLYRVISSVDSLELISILPKVIDSKTYLSDMDQIFMILTLIKLGIEFDSIRDQILTGSVIPTFDDIFAQLLRHSSTATRSWYSEASPDTSVMQVHLTLTVILRVFVVATEAKASDLIVPFVIDRVTFETGVISYMVVRLALLM